MKKKEEIKAIIFDVFGVLQLGHYYSKPINSYRETHVHEYMTKKLGIPLDQYFDALDTNYIKAIEGTISREKAINQISKNLKSPPKKLSKLFIKSYRKNFKFNKQLFKQVIKLKKKGYKIAILSDQWYLSKDAVILPKYTNEFDSVVISCDVGVRKPNPKIYKIVLKKLKLKPQQTIFIDNQKWNIEPAKKLGIKTILFKNNKQTLNQLKKFGVE